MNSGIRSVARSLVLACASLGLLMALWQAQPLARWQCFYTILPVNLLPRVEAAGGMGSVEVRTTADCPWTITNSHNWITVTNGSGRTGLGTATFAVAANTTNRWRQATLTVGGQNFTIEQAGQGGRCLAAPISYSPNELAPEAIAAAFGQGLSAVTEIARTVPLPTRLGNVTVRVRDSANVTREAPLFAVTPGQINFLIPTGAALGRATLSFVNNNVVVATGDININTIAPGIFAANANGQGVPAAVAWRIKADGRLFYEPLLQRDAQANRCVPLPLDLGPETDQLFLVLHGTGLRGRSALTNVTARIGGVHAPVLYAGAQGELVRFDQINVRVPRELKGRGEVAVQLTVDGQASNVVRITFR